MKTIKTSFVTLAFVFLFSNVGVAATETVNGLKWTYQVSDSKAYVGGGHFSPAIPTSTTGAIVIPGRLGGYTVAGINYDAFYKCTKLTSVTIPSGVTVIGSDAFRDCSSLTSIQIPNTVTVIGSQAFAGCVKLSSITLPESIERIGSGAFVSCQLLTSISIPRSVSQIASDAFNGCVSLSSIVVDSQNSSFESNDGVLYSKGKKTLISFPPGKSGDFVIPNSVTTIESDAFSGCRGLMSISIPNSVTSIGMLAFFNCTSLTTVSIPSGVTIIEPRLFENCTNLVSVSIPSSVTMIGRRMFYGCINLGEIDIPDAVTCIGNYAFENCSNLHTIVIPNSVTTIEPGAFENCSSLSSITIPGSVTDIGSYSFSGCSSLVTIMVPDSVTTLERNAFLGCDNLSALFLPTVFRDSPSVTNGVPANCSVLFYNLVVSSLHGISTPGVGVHEIADTSVTCSIGSPIRDERDSDVYYFCSGWKGTGNAPAHGSCDIPTGDYRNWTGTVSTTFSMSKNSSVTWIWQTNVWVFGNGQPLNWANSFGTTGGWNYELWRDDADHMSCLKSGTVSTGNTSSLQSTVAGPGRLSFDWSISANRGDYCRFLIDGVETNVITRSTAWRNVLLTLPGGNHSLEWRYERNSATAAGEDAAFLDNVEWVPGVTLTVASAYGTATPPVGQSRFTYNDSVHASVLAPEPSNGRKRVPTGWKGTGCVPATGTTTNVSFAITDNSSLTWQWKTQNRISVAVSGVGRCSFGSQWVDSGTTVTANIVPTKTLYRISLSGDTDGVTIDGTRLSIPSDKPREIAVAVEEVKLHLDVVSGFGQPIPAIGRTEWSHGTTINAHVSAPEPVNGTRRVCTGWVGTGSVPTSGTAADVTFTIVEDSSLTWNWRTEHLISLETEGEVESEFTQAWAASGTSIVVSYDITTSYAEIGLAGDSNGVTLDAMARTLTIPVDRPRAIILRTTRTLTLAEALDGTGIAWSTDPGTEWTAQTDVTFDGEDAGKSAFVSGNQVSGLTATIIGSGELRWRWMLNSSGVSGLDVFLDDNLGNPVFMFEEGGTWREAVLPILGDGAHTVRFEFWTSGQSPTDCAYLDSFSWTGDTLESSLAKALDATNLIWKTDEGWNWSVVKSNAFFGGEAARSASVGNGEVSGLETTVQGPGTLSWRWKLAIEGTAGMDVFVDEDTGSPMFAYDENGDWDISSLTFDDNDTHTIRFEFWNVDNFPADCAYLDKVLWTPVGGGKDGTVTTPESVPYAWLDEYRLGDGSENGYEAAALATAANGVNKVWECYVAGLSPTNAAARFEARIGFDANGKPVVTWTPDLNEGGTKHERVYRVLGAKSLGDAEPWADVTGLADPDAAGYRFFKAKVEMPE